MDIDKILKFLMDTEQYSDTVQIPYLGMGIMMSSMMVLFFILDLIMTRILNPSGFKKKISFQKDMSLTMLMLPAFFFGAYFFQRLKLEYPALPVLAIMLVCAAFADYIIDLRKEEKKSKNQDI